MSLSKEALETIADRAAQECVEALPGKLLDLLPNDVDGSEILGDLMNDIAQAIIETFQDRLTD
jgi:hypothetical protein